MPRRQAACLVWSSGGGCFSGSHMASCSEAEAPGAARGPVSSCLGPSKHEARSWCSHGPRLPLPGAPCESFRRRGLASQGHSPHPLKGSATAKGPRQGITASPLGATALLRCGGRRGQTPQPGQMLPPPLSATCQAQPSRPSQRWEGATVPRWARHRRVVCLQLWLPVSLPVSTQPLLQPPRR